MIIDQYKDIYYKAMLAKDSTYDGVFFVGVKTTGIFCNPSCPARKPKFENCEFFSKAEAALLASFRPCKKCMPLSHPNKVSPLINNLVSLIEANPEKRWKSSDFRELGFDESTARRQFKKRFGMTFIAYARARRMGLAMKQIKQGNSVIDAQLAVGYESGSGFRDAFSRILGRAPTLLNHENILKAAWLDTPLGPMLAIADEKFLYLLEFVDRRGLEREIERLRIKLKAAIIPGDNLPISSINRELQEYFLSKRSVFKTPLKFLGSEFQQSVWRELQQILPGQTLSYSKLAEILSKPSAIRAVANANGANQLAIIIPCHRVIGINGALTGYAGGLARKEWLLNHERAFKL